MTPCIAGKCLETPGIDRYDKIALRVNRWLTQVHPVALEVHLKSLRRDEIGQGRSGGVRVPEVGQRESKMSLTFVEKCQEMDFGHGRI